MTDPIRLSKASELLTDLDAVVDALSDARQRLLVQWQVKQLRLALKSYARRAEKGTDAAP